MPPKGTFGIHKITPKKGGRGSNKKKGEGLVHYEKGLIRTSRLTISKAWKSLNEETKINAKPFLAADQFCEEGRSLHDEVRHALISYYSWSNIPNTVPTKTVLEISDWAQLFQFAIAKEHLQIFSTKISLHDDSRLRIQLLMASLALSDPWLLFDNDMKENLLRVNNPTSSWRAAVSVLGSHYPDRTIPAKDNSLILEETARQNSSLTKAVLSSKSKDGPALTQPQLPFLPTGKTGEPTGTPNTITPSKTDKDNAAVSLTNTESTSMDTMLGAHETSPPKTGLKDTPVERKEAHKDVGKIALSSALKAKAKQSKIKKKTRFNDSRTFQARFDFRINLKPQEDYNEAIQVAVKKWFTYLRINVDSSLRLHPWWNNQNEPPLEFIKDWPTSLEDLNVYFSGCNYPSAQGTVYMKIHVTMDEHPNKLSSMFPSELYSWYQSSNWGCYRRSVSSSDNQKNVGYLMYTGNFIDVEALLALNNKALIKIRCEEEVGLKLRTTPGFVPTPTFMNTWRANKGQWFNQPWKRVYVDTDVRFVQHAKTAMISIWNTQESRPGNSKFRFVPANSTLLISPKGIEKALKAGAKHEFVVRSLSYVEIPDVLFLDTEDIQSGQTLRTFLMDLKHTITKKTLIHSVDQSKMRGSQPGQTLMCTCFQEHEIELQGLAYILAALVGEKLNEDCLQWFTLTAIASSKSVTFDESGAYSCADDNVHDLLLEEDVNGITAITLENIPQEEPKSDVKTTTDDYSFSSFISHIDPSKRYRTDSITEESEESDGSIPHKNKKSKGHSKIDSDDDMINTVNPIVEHNAEILKILKEHNEEKEQLREELQILQKLLYQTQENDQTMADTSPPNSSFVASSNQDSDGQDG